MIWPELRVKVVINKQVVIFWATRKLYYSECRSKIRALISLKCSQKSGQTNPLNFFAASVQSAIMVECTRILWVELAPHSDFLVFLIILNKLCLG